MIKKIFKSLGFIIAILLIILVISFINHKIKLQNEDSDFVPIGQQVEVNGHSMNVYVEGTGDTTLVFMSGGGTCAPVLDFKSLYSILSDKYRIVVVEKAGYGFSEDSNVSRDIDAVLSETREALSLLNIKGPFVLCPHSMSGIEALYWTQQYPDEVEAIIGLDMSVPEAYNDMEINIPLIKLSSFAANIGITRFIPSLAESDAIKYGTLTEEEKELYKVVFYRRTATKAMINEVGEIKKNAEKVANGQKVIVPILLFTSNGEGTGFDVEKWHDVQYRFIESSLNGKLIELDCPHYIHDYEYKRIAEEIATYLDDILLNRSK